MTKLRRRRQVNFHSFTHTHTSSHFHTHHERGARSQNRNQNKELWKWNRREERSHGSHVEGVGSGFKSADRGAISCAVAGQGAGAENISNSSNALQKSPSLSTRNMYISWGGARTLDKRSAPKSEMQDAECKVDGKQKFYGQWGNKNSK